MSKVFNIHSLKQQYACFNESELKLYVNNKVSKNLRFSIENHLLDCEVCSDIVEGLQLIYKEKNPELYLNTIQQKAKLITKNSTKNKTVFILWGAVALFVLSLGSFFLFSHQYSQLKQKSLAEYTNEKILEESSKEKNTSSLLKENSITSKKREETTSYVEKPKTKATAFAEKKQIEKTTSTIQKNKSIDANLTHVVPQLSPTVAAQGEVLLDDTETDDNISLEENATSKIKTSKKINAEKTKESVNSPQGAVPGVTSENPMQEAKKLYDKKQYAEAANLYLQIYYVKNSLEAAYLSAKSFYKNKNYQATRDLCNVILNFKSDFYEDVQWLLYQAYEEEHQLKEAKEILVKISEQNGKFAKQAKTKLKRLKESD